MSIETKLARAMSDLEDRGLLILQDPEVDTTRISRVGRGWKVTTEYDGEECGSRLVSVRDEVETTIRSWLKCQEQIDSL